ncbi:MAG: hypothetical protein GEU96_14430 [Propionibacteriales bacterium]|nr:hypothetical protein [Propionibacteriales bacterium]
MRSTKRSVGLLVASLLACGSLVACGGGSSAGDSEAKDSLNVWLYQKPDGTLSPISPASGPDGMVMSLMYESLLASNPQQELVPELAAAMPEISADAKTFTFKIRPDAKWSDGEPLTSKDVLFSYEMAATPESGSVMVATLEGLTFSAPDDETFVVESKTSNFGLLLQIGLMGIMPEHELSDLPVKEFATNEYFTAPKLASGPYKFVENKVDQYVKVTANPEYHKQPAIKDIFLKPVTADVAVAQLGTGEIDLASVVATDVESVKSLEGIEVTTGETGGFVRASWNIDQERFKDPRVRQAFLYGLDREAIVESALAGQGTVRNSTFGPNVAGDDLEQYPYDPEKAKALLKEAGWDSSKPVELSWIAGTNPDRDAAATAMEAQLNEVGIKIELNQVQASFFEDAYENQAFDMVLYGGGTYTTESWNVFPINSCETWIPNGANIGHYCNKELDKLMKEANATVDEAARLDLYKQAAAMENKDPSMMWIYNPDGVWAANSKLKNFEGLDPSGLGFWKAEDWTFEE